MKHKYRLKSAEKAVLHGFHNGDFSGADRIEEHNAAILADVYKRVQCGLSDYAYISSGGADGGLIHVISRDTVYSGVVRVSVFVRYGSGSDARIYPSSHKVLKRVKDLLNYGFPSGRLILVGGWYDEFVKRG